MGVIYLHAIKKVDGYVRAIKSSQIRVCHELNFHLPVYHSVHGLLELNSFITLTCGTHVWR
jgi:hypothetical protein